MPPHPLTLLGFDGYDPEGNHGGMTPTKSKIPPDTQHLTPGT
ncbi:MAG: hypothetical protein VKJ46_10110 [Leptolyngbyaceae bacterium]|nr:hypothetical protein [Leptolyngbyaceae bacterium]